jgi:DNA-binding transcriptional LysR family regulator
MKRLGPSRQIIVAAPDLINAVGAPGEPEGLVSFPSLALSRNTPKHTWDLRHVDGRECAVAFEPRYVTDDMAALRLTAERGNGIVQLASLHGKRANCAPEAWSLCCQIGSRLRASFMWFSRRAGGNLQLAKLYRFRRSSLRGN